MFEIHETPAGPDFEGLVHLMEWIANYATKSIPTTKAVTLPCIVCGSKLDPVFEDIRNQPSEGITFIATGNYGSTIFDPIAPYRGKVLEVNICDKCVVSAANGGLVNLLTTTQPRPIVEAEPFNPDEICWSGI